MLLTKQTEVVHRRQSNVIEVLTSMLQQIYKEKSDSVDCKYVNARTFTL